MEQDWYQILDQHVYIRWGFVYAQQGSVGSVSHIVGIFWSVVFGGACSIMVSVSKIGAA